MASTNHDTHHGGDSAPRGFGDTIWARLIALAIAVGLAWAFWSTWSEDVLGLLEDGPEALPIVAQPALQEQTIANPALEACLEKRLGDVQSMASDGVISEAQVAGFSQRATELCWGLHPN